MTDSKKIYKALADFQQEVPIIHKGATGYGYDYADLPTIFTTINPILKKHGLGFYQAVNNNAIKTVVFHVESGETLESETAIPQGVTLKGMNDFQVLGSAITYIRRYALASLLGLVTDKDTDASGKQEQGLDEEHMMAVDSIESIEELQKYYKANKGLGKDFDKYVTKRKKELQNENS